jgi:cyclopropane fatty-acyl-phospholipid synthase-like methyltransferase
MADETKQGPPDWNARYRERDTPWDSGIRSRELARVINEGHVKPGRALELGCGTGTNAVFLAKQGFDVTAIDLSAEALAIAEQKAADAGVKIHFKKADVCSLREDLGGFDFVFDRGCYHSVRRNDLAGFLETLRLVTRAGSKYLVLAGNANEQTEFGPPRVHEHEIRSELGPLFDVDFIREMRFEDKGGVDGPLGWSCLLTRKAGG